MSAMSQINPYSQVIAKKRERKTDSHSRHTKEKSNSQCLCIMTTGGPGPSFCLLSLLAKKDRTLSFIKVSLQAKQGVLHRELLLKSQILIQNVTEPILPLTVVYTSEQQNDLYVIQFDHPRLVDLSEFRLKLDESLFKDVIHFWLAHDVHYVPLLPVIVGKCVTN